MKPDGAAGLGASHPHPPDSCLSELGGRGVPSWWDLLFPGQSLPGWWPLFHFQGRMGGDFATSIRGSSCRALPFENYSGGGG